MKKKLLAVAVAGALAAPGLALAQSSVTISGIFKASLENLRIGTPAAGRAGLNTSENRIADDSSRILFNVVEDLGGGLQAIGQADLRMPMASGNFIAMSGNTHVGLRSASLGRIFVGRQDLHYGNTESDMSVLAGDLRADSVSILAYTRDGTAIAGATRTPNVIHYTTPNWGGFTAIIAYSTGPLATGLATGQATQGTPTASQVAQQGDLTTGLRKGSAININPNYAAANFQVGYSYWNSKPDGGSVSLNTSDQKSNKLYGSFKIAGFKIGLAWDKSTLTQSTANVFAGSIANGAKLADRTAWSIPISYTMGNNQFHFHYDKARDDKATNVQDGAKMVALSYQYTLSKRTSVGLTYAKITNNVGAAYNFFTSNSLGNSATGVTAGESPRLFAGTIRHAF